MSKFHKNPSVEVVFDFKRESANGGCGTVWVRIYESCKKRRYISTGVRVRACEWSDDYMVVNRDDAVQLNKMIIEQVEKCKAMIAVAVHECSRVPDVRQMKVDRSDASFLNWLENAISSCLNINDETRKHHRSMFRMLCDFGKIRRFENVTEKNLKEWLRWISEREVMKPGLDGKMHAVRIGKATVCDHWKRLSKYLRIAAHERRIPDSAFSHISVERGEEPLREHLNDDEIFAWLNTRMTTPCLEMTRLRFIVQMGCGLSFKDLMTKDFSKCQCINGRWCLVERREKTKHGFFAVLLPSAVEVLIMWEWKIPKISIVDYNRFLDRVAISCGIQKHVTSHVARHTYACYCLRHGVRIEAVQRTLGHKNIKTTQIYARLIDMDVLEAFDKMI